ncbi:MAG: glycosyltransferase family 4 protein [archaeon]|nr:glycosyltransferase family 4 protein [archaeon]
MKIAFVSTGSLIDFFPPKQGAIESLEHELIIQLQKRKHQIQLFASFPKMHNSVSLGTLFIQNHRLHNFYSMINAHLKAKQLDADIVHAHYPLTALPFLGKKPLIYTEHNWYNISGMNFHSTPFTPIFNYAQNKVYSKSDKIIALCTEMKQNLLQQKIPQEKIELIPNFVNSVEFSSQKKKPNSILFIGRLEKEKRLDLLLKALEGKKDYSLTIAGAGSQKNNLMKLADSLNINANFLGFVGRKKAIDLFASHSIFVLPSDFEVMSLAVLEAMSSECAVIASNTFGTQEQIVSEKNGLIFEKGNQNQLSKNLELLLSDEKLASKLGKNARQKVLKEFDSKIVAGKIEKVYESVL